MPKKERYTLFLLLVLYVGVIVSFSIVDYQFQDGPIYMMVPLGSILLLAGLYFYCTDTSDSHFVYNSSIIGDKKHYSVSIFRILSKAFFIMLGQIVYWTAYYPGGFNLDSYGQWMQANGDMPLSNWHPVFITLLYKANLLINKSLAYSICIQLLLYSFGVAILLESTSGFFKNKKIVTVFAVYYSLNPAIALCNIFLIKDVYFSIFSTFLLCLLGIAFLTDFEVIKKPVWQILYVFFCIFICLSRHNGLLLVLGSFIGLMLIKNISHKQVFVMHCIIVAGVVFFNIVIIHGLLDASYHSNILGEMVGLLMNAIVNAFINEPEHVPMSAKALLLSYATEHRWKELYILGEWDSCKWELGGSWLFIAEKPSTIIRAFLETCVACPRSVGDALIHGTRLVWSVVGNPKVWIPSIWIEDNMYGITPHSNNISHTVVNILIKLSYSIQDVIWHPGCQMMILMIANLKGYKRKNWCLLMPILIYNVGSMCLLCGPNYRYFYYQAIWFPVCLLLLLI